MELGKVTIHLSKSDCCYSPGEILKGHLEIDLPVPKKIKSVYVKFSGEGGVRFQNLMVISNTGKTQRILSHADEKYIQCKQECLKNSGSAGMLAVGKHIYPFSYHLPYDLPSSFQHEYGTIHYFLKVVLEQTKLYKQRSYKDFYVQSYLDLNLYPKLQEPCSVSLIKKSSFLWIDKIKLKINVKIPKTGYAIGESIFIYVEVINTSDRDILDLVFKLQKIMQFNATAPKKDSRTVITTLATTNLGLQPARRVHNFNIELMVPEFPCRSLNGSKIINERYSLEVIALRDPEEKIVEKVPLTIGFSNMNY